MNYNLVYGNNKKNYVYLHSLSKLILNCFMCWGVNLSRDLFLPRIHLFEFEDRSWCPESIRDGLTDSMQFFVNFGGHYRYVIKHIARVLGFSETLRIIDLGSGGGGPWIKLYRSFSLTFSRYLSHWLSSTREKF